MGNVHADLLETSAAAWFHRDETRQLVMHPTMRQRLHHVLTEPKHVHFD
jgi:hypothetical protein